jgi:hypothetical protein
MRKMYVHVNKHLQHVKCGDDIYEKKFFQLTPHSFSTPLSNSHMWIRLTRFYQMENVNEKLHSISLFNLFNFILFFRNAWQTKRSSYRLKFCCAIEKLKIIDINSIATQHIHIHSYMKWNWRLWYMKSHVLNSSIQ